MPCSISIGPQRTSFIQPGIDGGFPRLGRSLFARFAAVYPLVRSAAYTRSSAYEQKQLIFTDIAY
jgi:hypothetical protein